MSDRIKDATATRPVALTKNVDGSIQSNARSGDFGLGRRIHIEMQNPANADAIFTVPSGKTFTGTVYIAQRIAAGTLSLSAATGGVQATITGIGEDTVDVTIAGGAGNALTAVVAASGAGLIILDGWVK